MNFGDMVSLLPLIVTSASAVLVMLAIAARRHHGLAFALTLAGLGAALACLAAAWPMAPRQVTALLVIDRYALFYIGLALAAAVAVAMLSYDYLAHRAGRKEEFYLLLLLATAGAGVLAASSHFASLFLGLELLTVSLYALIAYRRGRAECIEAGVKYLVLAGASSAILLFGMALVYADLGTMRFDEIAARAAESPHSLLLMTGTGLLLVGIGFKLAVVPFHLWTPDVYEGAPAPVAAYVATVSKGAVFALLLRYVSLLHLEAWGVLPAVLAVLAAASMFAGNLLALRQDNVKRILAYSSIAHMGYLLVALLAGGQTDSYGQGAHRAAEAVTFYLVAYFVTTLGAFGVVAVLSGTDRDAGSLAEFRGLLWRRPALGVVLILVDILFIPADRWSARDTA
jgi:NADH-quinone oxidoreductase subunit N